jgi:hypothetical protein
MMRAKQNRSDEADIIAKGAKIQYDRSNRCKRGAESDPEVAPPKKKRGRKAGKKSTISYVGGGKGSDSD